MNPDPRLAHHLSDLLHAAVDKQFHACDEACLIAEKETRGGGYFAWASYTSHRNGRDNGCANVVWSRRHHLGIPRCGRQNVDVDAARDQLGYPSAGVSTNSCLCNNSSEVKVAS